MNLRNDFKFLFCLIRSCIEERVKSFNIFCPVFAIEPHDFRCVQNPSETLTWTDHKRSAGGEENRLLLPQKLWWHYWRSNGNIINRIDCQPTPTTRFYCRVASLPYKKACACWQEFLSGTLTIRWETGGVKAACETMVILVLSQNGNMVRLQEG